MPRSSDDPNYIQCWGLYEFLDVAMLHHHGSFCVTFLVSLSQRATISAMLPVETLGARGCTRAGRRCICACCPFARRKRTTCLFCWWSRGRFNIWHVIVMFTPPRRCTYLPSYMAFIISAFLAQAILEPKCSVRYRATSQSAQHPANIIGVAALSQKPSLTTDACRRVIEFHS